MANTDYVFSIASDTAGAALHARSLDAAIRVSAVVTALDGITAGGDVLTITFKDALSAGDETALGVLVGAHTGSVPTRVVAPTNSQGAPVVQTTWREGTATDFIMHNLCDKTTWYTDSARVEDEALSDSGDGLIWNSANTFWICVVCGRIPQEHRIQATYEAIIKVDSVVMTESPQGTTDEDYQINYATGDVTFNATQAGNTVEATYSYAQTSVFYVTPTADHTLRLTAVEVQFTDDTDLKDSVRFDIEGYVHSFVPEATVDDVSPNYTTSFPTNFRIPLGSPTIYKTMMDFIAEAQRAYPMIPALGGTSWRGSLTPIYVMRWPYQEDATRDLVADKGMRVKISLENDIQFGGTAAIATLYAVSTNGSKGTHLATEFNYSIQNDFPNQAVAPSVLSVEITDSTIVPTLDGINVNGDDVEIVFDSDLSAPEVTTLDTIVSNHQGVPFNNGPQRVNSIAVQDNATTTFETAATLNMEPVGVESYVLSFYCEVRVTDGNNNSQVRFQVLLDGSDIAEGGTEGKTFFDARSGSFLISTNRGAAPVIEMQWRQAAGTATTAQIRRIRLSAVPFLGDEE